MLGSAKLLAIASALAVLVLFSIRVEGSANSRLDTLRARSADKAPYWNSENVRVISLDTYQSEDYTLLQTQFVVRHGTCIPTRSKFEEFQDLFFRKLNSVPAISVKLPNTLRKKMQAARNEEFDGGISKTGYTKITKLGARARADAIGLPTSFSSDSYVISHTDKSCAKDTAKAFAFGYFGAYNFKMKENPKSGDRVLRFLDACPRYQREGNATAVTMIAEYEATAEMQEKLLEFKSKLRVPNGYAKITVKDLETVYSACAFDVVLFYEIDQWCRIINDDAFARIEYLEDLEMYYELGASAKINYEPAAELLKDIVNSMTDFINGKSKVVGHFRIGHTETIVPLLTLLGYSKAAEMPSKPTDKQIYERQFRSSQIGSSGANVEFRLYKKKSDGAYYVLIRVNEKTFEIPGCSDYLCPLETLLKLWRYYLVDYNFDEECA